MITFILFSINLWSKKCQADWLHGATGRKYYVIKLYGKLIVIHRQGIKRLKQRKILNKDFDYAKLAEIAIYETSNLKKNINGIPDKSRIKNRI